MSGKNIHFIGICGVAMSALAIALQHVKPKGHVPQFKVTGSDKGFFPPVSDYLKNAGIPYYPGWHPEKMGSPDLVVVGNVAGSENPEWIHTQEHKIPYVSYPELIAKFFIKKNSIVCAGTYGKTTSACLLTWILKENGFDPSYMFGGLSLNDMDSAHLSDASPLPFIRGGAGGRVVNKEYSVLEGDEYKTARWDNGPKFAHYSPTHLLLTSVNWDHADVYPKEGLYVDAFKGLIERIPKTGILVISEKVTQAQPTLLNSSTLKPITYGATNDNDYQYTDVQTAKDCLTFNLNHNDTRYMLQATCYGDYMAAEAGVFWNAVKLLAMPG